MAKQLIAPALWEYDNLDEAKPDADQYAKKAPGSQHGWGTTYVVQDGNKYYGPLTDARLKDWGFTNYPIVYTATVDSHSAEK